MIPAVEALLARAASFFDGLHALKYYVHNISPLNQTRAFINASRGLPWSFYMSLFC